MALLDRVSEKEVEEMKVNNYTTCRELKSYTNRRRRCVSGHRENSVRWNLVFGWIKQEVDYAALQSTSRLPLIVQQELYFDEGMPEMPCVYILSSGGQCGWGPL